MTESGFEMPPDHIVFQMLSTLDLRVFGVSCG